MKVLLVADAHGRYTWIPHLVHDAGSVDVSVIAGDLTNFGPPMLAARLIGMLPAPVLAVGGNCDPPEVHHTIERAGGVCVHATLHTLDDVVFMGVGGSNPTPFSTPFELPEEKIGSILTSLMEKAEEMGGTRVLVSHAPPYGVLDEVGGTHVGSRAVAALLGRVDAILCGHIHEARGIERVQGTLVVNPGPAFNAMAALVWVGDGVRAELMEVEGHDS
ncbi:metallophosphoesterase family protein [Methermicoccus shengliensis]|uniref:Metallophosphoesterase n=1 Tax=Methermicoccus shengliensis TaxID=660064 RepID=A0A832RVL4_9EURY|nr:metallophosphoesterase family protein [Methermicoccus shengliensis]KUK05180.1 MAG: Metallophosphoesterase [Euryarchaeota archaeon 55_53]KUK29633.1 MAG: Metallophosphoesterase [Methanosarcinales archeaon 56_1174]MDI3487340.1 uncharacterized protein [Methanosarcinales archaeon]MDN5294586.1 uncharacterized protein [Methanosarcinales archaeon]HIH69294.1 metallophosphoesterase [Methermicoccus shengliensis]